MVSLQKDNTTISNMFNDIANKYDFLNHFLSAGIDKLWRRKLINLIKHSHDPATAIRILDVATGTADLAIKASSIKNAQIVGIDISEQMLEVGKTKIAKKGLSERIQLDLGPVESLPYPSDHYHYAMVAFGARNFADLEGGLKEMHRVLKQNGTIYVLEFITPRYFPVKQLYLTYFKFILPLVGRTISKSDNAYTYLTKSVLSFPQRESFLHIMESAGFKNTKYLSLSLGIASIYIAKK